jgi:hypothetical protein
VPLATYTGWALRSGIWANDGCEASGQYIPFAATSAARMAAGDPRPSVQERYASYDVYRRQLVLAVDKLVRDRFLICDDTQGIMTRLLQAGLAAGVPAPQPNENAAAPDPHARDACGVDITITMSTRTSISIRTRPQLFNRASSGWRAQARRPDCRISPVFVRSPPKPREAISSEVEFQNEVPPPNLNCCTMSYFPFVSGTA